MKKFDLKKCIKHVFNANIEKRISRTFDVIFINYFVFHLSVIFSR